MLSKNFVNTLLMISATTTFPMTSAAQEELGRLGERHDSLGVSNRATIGFERYFNTYLWSTGGNYRWSSDEWKLKVGELFRSSLIQTNEKFIKDEQNFNIYALRNLNEKLGFEVDASSVVFSDNRGIGINRASIHSGLAGLRYQLGDSGYISPNIGMKSDNQTGQRDNGLSYRLMSQIGELDLSGYRTNFYGRFSEDRITPRKGESHAAVLSVAKTFVEGTKNEFRVQFIRNRRDFYFAADSLVANEFGVSNNIEQRIEEILDVTNGLDYAAGERLFFTFAANLRQRGISKNINYKASAIATSDAFDTDISEFKLNVSAEARYRSETLKGVFHIGYEERNEEHEAKPFAGVDRSFLELRQNSERRKNNSAHRTFLMGNGEIALTSQNLLTVSGFASLLRYDTPSAENTDDRDELLITLGLSDRQSLGPRLDFSLSADVVLNHVVYIFSDRSANNNWNRVFRLSPRIDYRPSSSMTTTNGFEVLANYTVYDFEQQVFSVRSFSFRQFSIIDSTIYKLSRRVALDFSARVKLYERGQLRWREFRERPVNYFDDRTFFGQFRYTPKVDITVAVGFRYFSLTRFRYQERERVFENRLVNYGPTCLIDWSMNQNARLVISGWYEIQAQSDRTSTSVSNVAMKIVWGL
jgi:hypothetical protein